MMAFEHKHATGGCRLGEFEERRRENLGLDEGETMTAPVVEDLARPTGAYFSKCALHFTQILFPMLCSAAYKDATNNQNTINRSQYPLKKGYVLKSPYCWIFFCA